MKPAPFTYVAPTTIEEAVSLLAAQKDSKIIAGGQSLLPLLNLRLARCEALVDIGHITELTESSVTDSALHLGALVRHTYLEHDDLVRMTQPLLAVAAAHIGHRAIRNHGTIGGSNAHADPSAELPAALVALGGSVIVASRRGRREVHAADLFVGHFQTSLADDELIIQVRVPRALPGVAWGFYEYAPRSGDFAHAGAIVTIDQRTDQLPNGRANELAVTWFATSPKPSRVIIGNLDELTKTRTENPADRDATARFFDDAFISHGGDSDKRSLAVTVAVRAMRRALQMDSHSTAIAVGGNAS